jgi:UDP-glucose 4-epimerase
VTWLVTGGAGYIGAHTVQELVAAGVPVVVLDDLSTGDAGRVPAGVPLVVAAVHDRAALRRTLRRYEVRGVVHLAARKSVPESIARPDWYHAENVGGLAAVLDEMTRAGVHRMVFSSSAAVYGNPTGRVTERCAVRPVNPYGHSKLLGERLLRTTAGRTRLHWTALRYFNVAGCAGPRLADRAGGNLIPLALAALRTGAPLTVTGVDFPTPDGTGIRDYVHVSDVARAHLTALRNLDGSRPCGGVFNVGTGRGFSVREVLAGLGEVAGVPVPQRPGPRRPGDPAEVVADVTGIRRRLGWTARYGLSDMLASAWLATGDARAAVAPEPALAAAVRGTA